MISNEKLLGQWFYVLFCHTPWSEISVANNICFSTCVWHTCEMPFLWSSLHFYCHCWYRQVCNLSKWNCHTTNYNRTGMGCRVMGIRAWWFRAAHNLKMIIAKRPSLWGPLNRHLSQWVPLDLDASPTICFTCLVLRTWDADLFSLLYLDIERTTKLQFGISLQLQSF